MLYRVATPHQKQGSDRPGNQENKLFFMVKGNTGKLRENQTIVGNSGEIYL